MVIKTAVQITSIVFYFTLSSAFWDGNTCLSDIFYLDIWKSVLQCFKHLILIPWESQRTNSFVGLFCIKSKKNSVYAVSTNK